MSDESSAGNRARRAIPLIAAALTVSVVAGLLYLRSAALSSSPFAPATSGPPQLRGYDATYDFVSPDVGWALVAESAPDGVARHFWVFKTVDHAQHWRAQLNGQAPSGWMEIRFTDAAKGVVTFYYGSVTAYLTSDAGAHWRLLDLPRYTFGLTFADADHGWALAFDTTELSNGLFSTVDGGRTWTRRVWPPDANVISIGGPGELTFKPGGEGWLGSRDPQPTLFVTDDGGSAWARVQIAGPFSSNPSQARRYFVARLMLLPKRGLIAVVGDEFGFGAAFVTFDSGRTWRWVAEPPSRTTLADLSFVDDGHWWVSRYGELFKTSDGGQTWHQVRVTNLLRGWSYQPAHVIDSRHAWSLMISTARSTTTALAMTSDAGVTWSEVNVPQPA
jgi:photosystem II stability/assembly factor-like uncharacterized protein